jgi:tetratricopeptide (TPR) repeat protein
MHPTEVPEGAILPLIPKAATIDQEKDPRLAVFAKSLAETCSIHNCATWLLRHEPWDFAGVYYSGIDHFSHTFMDFHPPRRDSVPEDLFDVYKDVVSGAYRFHDMLLERLLQLVPPETTVVLVSDHGFHSDHLRLRAVPREPAGPAAQHRGIGILAMKGPGILRDERIYGASVLDITPTILSIFGLPVGRDMDGRVLVQAFKEPPATDAIESWERAPGACGMHPADLRTDAESAKAVIDQFVALGYVEQEEDQQKSVAKAVRELRYNRARALMDARNPLAALSILSELSSEWPDDYRFRQHLAACYIALSRFLEAKTILLSFVERSEARKGASGKSGVDTDGRHVAEVVEDDAAASSSILVSEARRDWMMGIILHEEGDKERSLECLLRAEKADPSLPNLHILLGGTYLAISRLEDARRAFLRALDTDGDSADGYLGLAQVSLRRRENQDAAEKALIAVGLQHYLPLGHFVLGLALARLGYFDRSIQAFETCLSLIPSFLNAHRCLAALHSRPGGDKNKAGHHRDMVMHISRSRAQPRT